MLSGKQIDNEVKSGRIFISDYNMAQLNPNSYNLKLGNKLLKYQDIVLDPKREPKIEEIIIPDEGLILNKFDFYLGVTQEETYTCDYVPLLDGRSSIGRMGLFVHVTAGFGDIGFYGRWTLELFPVKNVKVYPGMEICQISYHPIDGDNSILYNGRYQHSEDVVKSSLFLDYMAGCDK